MEKASSLEQLTAHLSSPQRTVFVFTADWCGDCTFIYPFLDDLAADFPHLTFLQVDRDQFMDLAKDWDIFGIPSLVVTEKGKELGRLVNRARKTRAELSDFLKGF